MSKSVKSALPSISIVANKPKASEINGTGSGSGQFTISRSGGSASTPLVVRYTVGGTATNGIDYSVVSGVVTIPAKKSSAVVNVFPIDDHIAEPSETVTLAISSNPLYTVSAKRVATVTIADSSPTISVLATKPNAAELNGATTGMGQFQLTRTGGSTSGALLATYTLGGTATNGVDFTTLTGITKFNAGKSTTLVNVVPIDDYVKEPTESVMLTISAAISYHIAAGKSVAKVNIANHARSVYFSVVTPQTTPENTALTLTYASLLTQTDASSSSGKPLAFTIQSLGNGTLAIDGTAAAAGARVSANDTLTWTPAANFTGRTLAFNIEATDGTNATPVVPVTVTVTPPPVYFSKVAPQTTPKNTSLTLTYASLLAQTDASSSSGKPLAFSIQSLGNGTLAIDGAAAAVGAAISTNDTLTWTPATDFTGTTLAFNIEATDGTNTTSSVPVMVTVTVPPIPTLTVADAWVFQGGSQASDPPLNFNVTLSTPTTIPVSVSYTTTNKISGILTFAPGETEKAISVPDSVPNATESANFESENIGLTLSNPSTDLVLANTSATGTVYFNNFAADQLIGSSNSELATTLNIANMPALLDTISIRITLFAEGPLDQLLLESPSGQTIVFADNSNSTVPTTSISLSNVTFQDGQTPLPSNLSSYTGVYSPAEPLAGLSGTQLDGDWTVEAKLSEDSTLDWMDWSMSFTPSLQRVVVAHPTSVTEPLPGKNSTANFILTLSAPSTTPVSVYYATVDGTAQAGVSYTATSGNAVFAPGQTSFVVSVPVLTDGIFDPNATFSLLLSSPSGAALGTLGEVATIVDTTALVPTKSNLTFENLYVDTNNDGSFTIVVTIGNTSQIVSPGTMVSLSLESSGLAGVSLPSLLVPVMQRNSQLSLQIQVPSDSFTVSEPNLNNQWVLVGDINLIDANPNDNNLIDNDISNLIKND